MRPIRLIPQKTRIPFLRLRHLFLSISAVGIVVSLTLFGLRGLNLGIDFLGGIMMEVATPGPADLGRMRTTLNALGLGEVALQEFGKASDVLVRVSRQPGDEKAQLVAVDKVKKALSSLGQMHYRRIELVGPKVSAELVEAGTIAVVAAVALMLVYIWFRFELQFGVGAVLALIHDVIMTIGLFAATGIEFNLSSIAAILTIVGYSINDTVVVYDRVRENLRKYKAMPLMTLLELSVNETLSRTTMTSLTTLLALIALFLFGGTVIAGFTLAMIWGIVVGTYSSIFVAVAFLLWFKPRRSGAATEVAKTP